MNEPILHPDYSLSLKAARVEKGYTQEALAERLGITKRSYIKWENGEVLVKPYMVYAVAYVLKMEPDRIRVPVIS
ncbi:helix-turn-helix transcriptional regulator [Terribacillus saccharophilus]|uniref:helix-turn-helix transcriptional regulator n=1 Tax=Terribacillus saccharophilus TaxID=361277 RepID=UPI002DCE4106|nr:helix-turn-helix transcriptional regulator [Terribacillus saccharophilus]MEC0288946.1 helix-turn-helix transcriptional regulator [Terribacillus saccharophilus]